MTLVLYSLLDWRVYYRLWCDTGLECDLILTLIMVMIDIEVKCIFTES